MNQTLLKQHTCALGTGSKLVLYIKGRREVFFITRPSIRPSVQQEDEEENEVRAAAAVTRGGYRESEKTGGGGRGGRHPAGFWGLQAGCRSDV